MRLIFIVAPLLILMLIGWLYGVPAAARLLNRTRQSRPAPGASDSTVAVVDLHSDALLWNRDLLSASSHGHVDLPRLRDGGVIVQVFSATNSFPLGANYERTPPGIDLVAILAVCNRWPPETWWSPVQRALFQAARLHRLQADSGGVLVPVTRSSDVPDATLAKPETVGCLLSIEGLHGLHGSLDGIDRLFAAGYRIFGLVHMTDNEVAGSAHGWRKGGLTPFGRRVVARIDSLGGIIDLAHASTRTIDDVLDTGTRRVMVSHTGVVGTCPGNRNLSDAELDRIASAGGLVGVGFWKGAVCGPDAGAIARAIRYTADRIGVERVALGSDFDGAVVTPFDAAGVRVLVPALASQGFSSSEIAAILAGNALRFLAASLPAD